MKIGTAENAGNIKLERIEIFTWRCADATHERRCRRGRIDSRERVNDWKGSQEARCNQVKEMHGEDEIYQGK